MPPLTANEAAQKQWCADQLNRIAVRLQQENLNNAVLLAQQAAHHGGELEEWFAEIGRRYAHLLDVQPKPKLRVVKGGAA